MSSRDKIARDVADPEQRQLVVAAQIRNGLPLQLRGMRENRGWTQATLAEKLGTTQNTVSRLENPKTSKPTITTLRRIAEAFDVALIVKFAPFSEFIDSLGGMSPKSVAVPSYGEDLLELGRGVDTGLAAMPPQGTRQESKVIYMESKGDRVGFGGLSPIPPQSDLGRAQLAAGGGGR